jgi:transcriptional regulator with XRE-family HTH domain
MRAEDLFAEIERSDPEFRATWAVEGPKLKLGLNVYRLRSERDWTQVELASRAGMSQPRIAEIERGDGNPRFETLIRLANALGASLSTLVAADSVAASLTPAGAPGRGAARRPARRAPSGAPSDAGA